MAVVNIHRRRFIQFSMAGIVAAGVGFGYFNATHYGIVRSVVRKRLAPLDIPEEMISRFVIDLEAQLEKYHENVSTATKIRLASIVSPLYEHTELFNSIPTVSEEFRKFEENVITRFLMSTDYFHDKDVQAKNKPISYLRYYNPFEIPCSNPFVMSAYQ